MAELEKSSKNARPAGILPDRAQPHNPKIEQAVLAAILREPQSCTDIAITLLGSGGDVFYVAANRDIYLAAIELNAAGTAPDLLSVAQKLRSAGKLDAVGGELYLAELFSVIATTVNLEAWCKVLVELAMLRRMINACSGALTKCFDNDADPVKLVEEIETDIYNIRNVGVQESAPDLKTLVIQEFQTLMAIKDKKIEVGIPTGFNQLDEYTGGLKAGEMFVLAARPSIGKTSLGLNIIANIVYRCPNPRPVAFFSLEMTDRQIARRLLCTEAQMSEKDFWNGAFRDADLGRLTAAASKIRNAKLFIDPTGGLTISELRAKARRLKSEHNIELIVIDYLQLMHADTRLDRQLEVAEISGGIKKLAKDLQIPVLVLAQLNREVDKNSSPNARPKLANLRDSGAIEQDADVVAFLHRNRDEAKNLAPGESVDAELIIEKNRNGQIGMFKLLFYPYRTEFVPAAPMSEEFAPAKPVTAQ